MTIQDSSTSNEQDEKGCFTAKILTTVCDSLPANQNQQR